jgi:hypothetical protein
MPTIFVSPNIPHVNLRAEALNPLPGYLIAGARRSTPGNGHKTNATERTTGEKPDTKKEAASEPRSSTKGTEPLAAPRQSLPESAIPVLFRRWLHTTQGHRFKETLGADYDAFVRQFSEKLKPVQQEIFVIYMQGEIGLNASIAATVNRRFGLVDINSMISEEQVKNITTNKATALNSILSKASNGRFANIKLLRDTVGFGLTNQFARFLRTSKAKVVEERLGAKAFTELKDAPNKWLN